MALAPGQGQWYTWATVQPLVITLLGLAINSLYFPSVPSTITCIVGGGTFYIVPSGQPQIVPVTAGYTTVTLTALSGFTIYVFASSAAFSPGV